MVLILFGIYLSISNTAGEIMVGFRDSMFKIVSFTPYQYCASIIVKNKDNGFSWQFTVIYGYAYA